MKSIFFKIQIFFFINLFAFLTLWHILDAFFGTGLLWKMISLGVSFIVFMLYIFKKIRPILQKLEHLQDPDGTTANKWNNWKH